MNHGGTEGTEERERTETFLVKGDGGTLRQGGSALAWDDHGDYEVALDAGSLTLSP